MNVPIYFKTMDLETSTYLIAIIPKKMSTYVEIKREQISKLKGQVTKTIKTAAGESWIAEDMVTAYTRRTYTVR
jgi:hypothetical protein